MRISHQFLLIPLSLFLASVLSAQEIATRATEAKSSYSILYSFPGRGYGDSPMSGVILDPLGNLYGTTAYGGDLTCALGSGGGCGTIFKLSPTGVRTVLYNFRGGTKGSNPYSNLVRDEAGNLYGTAYQGDTNCNPPYGCGLVFKLGPRGTYTLLHSFIGQPNDGQDAGELMLDEGGNLCGTTTLGGYYNYGTIFTMDATGREKVLHSFNSSPDGASAGAGLLRTPSGEIFGTTSYGGTIGGGTVFKLDLSGDETVLYNFGSTLDGDLPGTLIHDNSGNLYGTNETGGAFLFGTVFKLDTTGKENVLYSFRANGDGAYPRGVVRDAAGNLYGTAYGGTAEHLAEPYQIGPGSELHRIAHFRWYRHWYRRWMLSVCLAGQRRSGEHVRHHTLRRGFQLRDCFQSGSMIHTGPEICEGLR